MKRVIVGLSGGVDSSVSALLLKKEGYEVVGVTFLFTPDADFNDAISVAKTLDIEHHVLDYRELFNEKIISKFIEDYKSGITPNPCVLCNKTVKLKLLYDLMKKYNCDFFATGHYAKITNEGLFLSSDPNKDQTYFLSEVKREMIDKMLLPLEGIIKEEVRKIASENNLITASKKDSTDVCFITSKFKEYMMDKIKPNKGDVINIETNEVIGTHNGLMFYTIGQRKGLNIGGNADRLFVVGKDVSKNILYVAMGDDNSYLYSDSCIIENVNFISNLRPNNCSAKFRYRQKNNDVKIEYLSDCKIKVIYENGVKAVTPGQACVLYLNDECLGGGIIKEVYKNNEKIWYL